MYLPETLNESDKLTPELIDQIQQEVSTLFQNEETKKPSDDQIFRSIYLDVVEKFPIFEKYVSKKEFVHERFGIFPLLKELVTEQDSNKNTILKPIKAPPAYFKDIPHPAEALPPKKKIKPPQYWINLYKNRLLSAKNWERFHKETKLPTPPFPNLSS